jgi:hypothetical protein
MPRSHPFRILPLCVLAVAALGLCPAASHASETWTVNEYIHNQTPWDLHLMGSMRPDFTSGNDPKKVIESGSGDLITITNATPGTGLASITTYGAYDHDSNEFVGMVQAQSGIDCNNQLPVLPWTCLDSHRWEKGVVDSGGRLAAQWTDNGASPASGRFTTTIDFHPSGRPGKHGKPHVRTRPPRSNGIPFFDSSTVINGTPFTQRMQSIYYNEGTSFEVGPKLTLEHGQTNTFLAANYRPLHGAQVVAMYDSYANRRYVGSTVVEGGVECTTFLDDGCTFVSVSADSAADALPGAQLRSHAEYSPIPMPAFGASFVIEGGGGGAAGRPAKRFAPKDCSKPRVKPGRIVLSCGDSGLFVKPKHWSRWGQNTARGRGQLRANECSPSYSCGPSQFTRYPVHFRLSDVRDKSCGGRRVDLFTELHLRFEQRKPSHAKRIRGSRLFCSS